MALRVTQPFAGHDVGEVIVDASVVTAILDSDQAAFVVAIPDPAPAAPAQIKE